MVIEASTHTRTRSLATRTTALKADFERLEARIHAILVAHGVRSLRIAVGAVFLGFGILKFFPGVSPAENIAEVTFDKLSFGLIPSSVALVGIATVESFIGLSLILGRWIRLASWLLVFELIGILSPLVLLPGRLFSGPYGAPTLEGQYVIKDVILVGAAMVIAAGSFRGGRMIRDEPASLPPPGGDHANFDAHRKLEIVLAAAGTGRSVAEVCERNGITETEYFIWRETAAEGAGAALAERYAER